MRSMTENRQYYNGVDAAYPGAQMPPGTHILAAYVGIPGQGNRSPDTPHIWTADEWNEYIDRDPELRVLPLYVHNYDDGQPEKDAMNGVAAIRELGWAPHRIGAQRRILVIDCETLVDYSYFYNMSKTVYDEGFSPVLYGSSMVTKNAMVGGRGYWVASLTPRTPTTLPKSWRGQQWSWHGAWDWSVFDGDLYAGCGRGLRHGT